MYRAGKRETDKIKIKDNPCCCTKSLLKPKNVIRETSNYEITRKPYHPARRYVKHKKTTTNVKGLINGKPGNSDSVLHRKKQIDSKSRTPLYKPRTSKSLNKNKSSNTSTGSSNNAGRRSSLKMRVRHLISRRPNLSTSFSNFKEKRRARLYSHRSWVSLKKHVNYRRKRSEPEIINKTMKAISNERVKPSHSKKLCSSRKNQLSNLNVVHGHADDAKEVSVIFYKNICVTGKKLSVYFKSDIMSHVAYGHSDIRANISTKNIFLRNAGSESECIPNKSLIHGHKPMKRQKKTTYTHTIRQNSLPRARKAKSLQVTNLKLPQIGFKKTNNITKLFQGLKKIISHSKCDITSGKANNKNGVGIAINPLRRNPLIKNKTYLGNTNIGLLHNTQNDDKNKPDSKIYTKANVHSERYIKKPSTLILTLSKHISTTRNYGNGFKTENKINENQQNIIKNPSRKQIGLKIRDSLTYLARELSTKGAKENIMNNHEYNKNFRLFKRKDSIQNQHHNRFTRRRSLNFIKPDRKDKIPIGQDKKWRIQILSGKNTWKTSKKYTNRVQNILRKYLKTKQYARNNNTTRPLHKNGLHLKKISRKTRNMLKKLRDKEYFTRKSSRFGNMKESTEGYNRKKENSNNAVFRENLSKLSTNFEMRSKVSTSAVVQQQISEISILKLCNDHDARFKHGIVDNTLQTSKKDRISISNSNTIEKTKHSPLVIDFNYIGKGQNKKNTSTPKEFTCDKNTKCHKTKNEAPFWKNIMTFSIEKKRESKSLWPSLKMRMQGAKRLTSKSILKDFKTRLHDAQRCTKCESLLLKDVIEFIQAARDCPHCRPSIWKDVKTCKQVTKCCARDKSTLKDIEGYKQKNTSCSNCSTKPSKHIQIQDTQKYTSFKTPQINDTKRCIQPASCPKSKSSLEKNFKGCIQLKTVNSSFTSRNKKECIRDARARNDCKSLTLERCKQASQRCITYKTPFWKSVDLLMQATHIQHGQSPQFEYVGDGRQEMQKFINCNSPYRKVVKECDQAKPTCSPLRLSGCKQMSCTKCKSQYIKEDKVSPKAAPNCYKSPYRQAVAICMQVNRNNKCNLPFSEHYKECLPATSRCTQCNLKDRKVYFQERQRCTDCRSSLGTDVKKCIQESISCPACRASLWKDFKRCMQASQRCPKCKSSVWKDVKSCMKVTKRSSRYSIIGCTQATPTSHRCSTPRVSYLKRCTANVGCTMRRMRFRVTSIFLGFFDNKNKINKNHRNRQPQRRRQGHYTCDQMFMMTLKKTPCVWFYKRFPYLYPHLLSVLKIWRQLFHIWMFLLAFFVWYPALVFMDMCRILLTCCCYK